MSMKHETSTYRNHILSLVCLTVGMLVTNGCSSETTASPAPTAATDGDYHRDKDHVGRLHHDDHEYHEADDSPSETYEAAVEAIVGMDQKIRRAISANDNKTADIQLHELGRALQDLNGLAKHSNTTYEQRQSVQGAVAKLFEAFRAVDATMHGQQGMSYDEAAIDIEENLDILQNVCAHREG